MSTKKQSLLRIIAATSVTLFTLFASFFGIYAWYVAYRSKQLSADAFHVTYTNDFLQQIDIYNLKTDVPPTQGDDGKITYTFSSTSADTFIPREGWKNKVSLDLGTFDPLNISPTSLILITLKDDIPETSLTHFRLSLTTATAYDACLLSGANRFTKTNNPFSSVLTFSALPLTADDFKSATETTDSSIVFSFANAVPSSDSSFIKEITSSGTDFKEDSYQQQFSLLKNTSDSPMVTSDTKYIALFPQYSKDIMEFLFTLNLNNSVLNDADVIKDGIRFSCDWGLVI